MVKFNIYIYDKLMGTIDIDVLQEWIDEFPNSVAFPLNKILRDDPGVITYRAVD